jgi:hypothetical protein
MKNYLVFIGEYYYPNGGIKDFKEDFNTLDEAKQYIEDWLNNEPYYLKTEYWYHVYSIEDKTIVLKN